MEVRSTCLGPPEIRAKILVNQRLAKGKNDSSDSHSPDPGSIYQLISIVIVSRLVQIRFGPPPALGVSFVWKTSANSDTT